MIGRTWVWAAIGLAIACRSRPAEAGPLPCPPSTGSLAADASADGLAGRYRLQMVATAGPRAGSTEAGELQLLPYRAGDRSRARAPGATNLTAYPFYGSTDVGLEAVGAVAGELKSLDPASPGVLVIWMAPRSDTADARVMLRLGADANRQDVVRFDGGYTVLRVREIEGDGFTGDWESGAPLPRARGHFCAVRLAEEDD